MKFSLPGQLRGPECNRVMKQAIALGKKVEPWFYSIESNEVLELGIVLRVDGSLGSFGPEGIENIVLDNHKMECDVVIADRGWAKLDDGEIAAILREHVKEAILICLRKYEIAFNPEELAAALS